MRFHNSLLKTCIKNAFKRVNENIVVLEPHRGLGDAIICLGLVRHISRTNPSKRFYYACHPHYYHAQAWMFQDLPNVFLLPVDKGRQAEQFANLLNCTHTPIGIVDVDITRFDAYFYEQHGVNFDVRWEDAAVPPGPRSEELKNLLNPQNEKFILVCDASSTHDDYELKIDNPESRKVIQVKPLTDNIFDWHHLTREACEIHTVDTAYVHFVESLFASEKDKGLPLLYYHLAKDTPGRFTRRLPWREVAYNRQFP
jgi:hypothetical protein